MRNKTLDIAKGIAMISIILGHLSVWRINCVVFTYHIPIFYLITGYFLFGAEKNSFHGCNLGRTYHPVEQLPEVCGEKSQNPFGPILCGLFVDHNVFNSTQYVFGRGCEDTGNKVD